MMEDFNTYHLIDRYLRKELSPEELQDFRNRVQADKAFADEVRIQELGQELIVEDRFYKVMEGMEPPGSGSHFARGIAFGIGALLLIGGSYLVFYKNDSKTEKPQSALLIKKEPGKQEEEVSKEVPATKEVPLLPNKNREPKSISSNKEGGEESLLPLPEKKDSLKKLSGGPVTVPGPLAKEEVSKTVPETDKCAHTVIAADAIAYESCEGDSTGIIEIPLSRLKGGEAPYTFSLGKDYQSANFFEHLLPGNYVVMIKDHNGCIHTKRNIAVKSKSCLQFDSYSFNPSYGEQWSFPFSGDYPNFKLRITNKEGQPVYTAEIKDGSPASWNGTSMNGSVLPSGTYLYQIEFPNGKTRQGYISIIE